MRITPLFRRIILALALSLAATDSIAAGNDSAALPIAPSAPQPAQTASINGVRAGRFEGGTRVVLDLSHRFPITIRLDRSPVRLAFDFGAARWLGPSQPILRAPALTGVAVQNDGRDNRLVLDLAGPVTIRGTQILEPSAGMGWRLVVDLGPTAARDMQPVSLRVGQPQAAAVVQPVVSGPGLSLPRGGTKPVIVLDAGHGGRDPGAISPSGRHEKTLTLAVARAIKKRLEASGRYQVVMTRDGDEFIPLRERVEIARRANPTLFLSIHADSIRDRNLSGLSLYTLSETASDSAAAALAARENKEDAIAGVDLNGEAVEVSNILIDLARRETNNLSSHLAATLVMEFSRETQLLNSAHRFAGFAVLKAPDVPSVLVELGYLSNRDDEKRLFEAKHQARLAAAIERAIGRYLLLRERGGLHAS